MEGWAVTVALKYRIFPDVVGGVLPDAFLQRIEELMQRQINVRLKRKSSIFLLVRSTMADDDILTLHGILLTPRGADVYWQGHGFDWGLHRDSTLTRLYGGDLVGSSVVFARYDELTAKADRLVRMLTLIDQLHGAAQRQVERLFSEFQRRKQLQIPQYYGHEARAILQAVRDMIRDAWYHKRSLVHMEGDAWLRRYADTCQTYLERAHATWPDEDNLSQSFTAGQMRRPVMQLMAHSLVEAMRGVVARDDAGAVDVAMQQWRELEAAWNAPGVQLSEPDGMYAHARDSWNRRHDA